MAVWGGIKRRGTLESGRSGDLLAALLSNRGERRKKDEKLKAIFEGKKLREEVENGVRF